MSEEDCNNDPNSSDSDDDGAASPRKKVLIVKPLPWRSQEVSSLFRYLDRKNQRQRGARSLSMVIERRTGAPSTRPQPAEEEDI